MSDSTVQSLDGVGLFKPMAREARAALARQCRWRRFAAQEQIIDRHDESRDVFFVISGKVRVVNYSLAGREVSFDDLGTGHFFGELAAIDGKPRSANVVALTDTVVAAMAPALFQKVVSSDPAIAMSVLTHLASVVRRATARIMDLSTLGANNRVHAEILRLAKEGTIKGNTAVIAPIPLHSDIAGRVSTTRETVARVFSDLTRTGLVERCADRLVVLDLARIEAMVEDVRGD